ncbi:zinc ABC transporter substrate-binding protein [Roseibium sp. Sym1]|uniref:zinc ABC transporter substrate-binding protein n=1 Tax=Roseibium sp. Sym1 TaxID=3016006 RepID=UPI0022B4AEB5|nr:zinc ABC transporter substrate-binding protein [Roseibium sp. Sym1]
MTFQFSRHLAGFGKRGLLSAAFCSSLAATSFDAMAEAPSVVTTIKPLHSIAAAVMEGVGEPHILIDGAASPHGFALKPSQAFLLQGADVVFWIGPDLTASLAKPISSMATGAEVVEMMDVPGISHLGLREGANFEAHDHEDGEHHAEEEHGHDDHGHDEHSDSDHDDDQEGHVETEHDHGNDHAGEVRDPHIWLNPDNGIAIAAQMAETLAAADPDNAGTYRENAEAFRNRIEALERDIEDSLQAVKDGKFIVFHDAYHHFEHHFEFEASGAISVSPETLSSAERIGQVRNRIKELDVSCVFQEPQFEAKLVDVVMEGSNARTGVLDPLGTRLNNGKDLYPDLLKTLSDALTDCLEQSS